MLNIALTKGRLEDRTIELLKKAGVDCSPLLNKGRKLIITLEDKYSIIFAKANDVITYVEYGVSDVGVVGKDTILEMNRPIYEIMDLNFGKCSFAVAAPHNVNIFTLDKSTTIATKYPNVTRSYFESLNMDVDIVKIEGSVELAPILKLADAIVDIVETGKTLKENGLEVIRKITDISARLVVNPVSLKLKAAEIDLFSKLLTSSITK
ncbi:MAG: ATP phosphoribosyltransferase [Christensenellaceae bacterium]|jgi:ATP phosphoribosyltransferase|nr:ATP phosphoribosyltransferase [Christensenellaceae bacterium]